MPIAPPTSTSAIELSIQFLKKHLRLLIVPMATQSAYLLLVLFLYWTIEPHLHSLQETYLKHQGNFLLLLQIIVVSYGINLIHEVLTTFSQAISHLQYQSTQKGLISPLKQAVKKTLACSPRLLLWCLFGISGGFLIRLFQKSLNKYSLTRRWLNGNPWTIVCSQVIPIILEKGLLPWQAIQEASNIIATQRGVDLYLREPLISYNCFWLPEAVTLLWLASWIFIPIQPQYLIALLPALTIFFVVNVFKQGVFTIMNNDLFSSLMTPDAATILPQSIVKQMLIQHRV